MDLDEIEEDDRVDKGDFAIMMASVIPCFCGNIDTPVGETCDQESFSCIE